MLKEFYKNKNIYHQLKLFMNQQIFYFIKYFNNFYYKSSMFVEKMINITD
jgi:hypothetical protein